MVITSGRLQKASGKKSTSKATRRTFEPPTDDMKRSLFQKLKGIKKGEKK